MIRKTFLWAILGLLACAGLASESQASLVANGSVTSAGTPGGNVTISWAVYDKDGADYGTGNATVEGSFGAANFLYLYQISTTNEDMTQMILRSLASAPNFIPLISGTTIVDGVLINADGSLSNGATRSTTLSFFPAGNPKTQIRGAINDVAPPSASGIIGFISNYGPDLLGRLTAQQDTDGGNVTQIVDVPTRDSDIPPPVPEPGTLVLSAIALVGGFAMRRRMVVA